MFINWSQFSPWSALAGGAGIGLAVAALILLNGRIAGISGIVGGLFKRRKGDVEWRIAFVAGLIVATLHYCNAGFYGNGLCDGLYYSARF